MKNQRYAGKQRGFTLIEALVAAIVLSVGLLGLAGLQATSQKLSQSAYQRTQAANLAYQMADAIRANSRNISVYTAADLTPEPCDPDFSQNTGDNAAENDIDEWLNAIACTFRGSDFSTDPPEIALSGNLVTVSIQWNEERSWKRSDDEEQDDGEDARDEFSVTIQI